MHIARAHFILYVRDARRAADFYRRVLAAEPVLDVPGMTEFDLGGAVLGLMPEAGIVRLLDGAIDPVAGGSPPRAEVYLVVDEPVAAYERAVAAGARALSAPVRRGWGDVVGYVQDGDGHVLALASRGAA